MYIFSFLLIRFFDYFYKLEEVKTLTFLFSLYLFNEKSIVVKLISFYFEVTSLLYLFNGLAIQSSYTIFSGSNLASATCLGMMMLSNATYYYVSETNVAKLYILDENMSFLALKAYSNPAYMITLSNSLYITGDINVWKADKDLNILITYSSTGTTYKGIYHNSTNDLIYVAQSGTTAIHVFNLTLSLIRSFPLSTYRPYSLAGYNNQLYVGTTVGFILVVVNEVMINSFNGCNGGTSKVTSIFIDRNGYMATTCDSSFLYLYNTNGTYAGKSITTPTSPRFLGYNSKCKFVQVSYTKVSIYN
jgi:hypothetical protein